MGFSFGLIVGLNSRIVTITTIGVIFFIIAFEFLTGFLEYIVSGSPLHKEMVQTIYKELTMMGVVSFCVVMVNASKSATDHADWIIAIDFSHIMLFYLAFFFVFHAIYIMRLSFLASKNNIRYQSVTISNLITDIAAVGNSYVSSFLYYFDFLPLSNTREAVEFNILSILFIDKNWFPENIDFAMYMTFCYEKFAMNTIERGLFSWTVLILLVIMNFIRVKFNLFSNCGHTDIFASKNSANDDPQHRLLAAGSSPDIGLVSKDCYLTQTVLFLFCGFFVTVYTTMLLLVCRYYIKKLISLAGVDCVNDYITFLEFLHNREVSMLNPGGDNNEASRFTFSELKSIVTKDVNKNKHHNHKEILYEFVLQHGTKLFGAFVEMLYDILHSFYYTLFLFFKGATQKAAETANLADLFNIRPRGRTISHEEEAVFLDPHALCNENTANSSEEGHGGHSSGTFIGKHGKGRVGRSNILTVNSAGGGGVTIGSDADVLGDNKFLGIQSFQSEEAAQAARAAAKKRDLEERERRIKLKKDQQIEKDKKEGWVAVEEEDPKKKLINDRVNRLKNFTTLKVFKLFSSHPKSNKSATDEETINSVLDQIKGSSEKTSEGFGSRFRSATLPEELKSDTKGTSTPVKSSAIRNARRVGVTNSGPVKLVSRVESYRLMQLEAKERLQTILQWTQANSVNVPLKGNEANEANSKKVKKDEEQDEDEGEDEDDVDVISIENGVGSHTKNKGSVKKLKVQKKKLEILDYVEMMWDYLEKIYNRITGCLKWLYSIFAGCFKFMDSKCNPCNSKVSPGISGVPNRITEDQYMLPENIACLFLFGKPTLLFLAFEVCVVLNCLYLANWAINFIYLVEKSTAWKELWQIAMVCPLIFNVPFIGIMSRYCAVLTAFLEVDCEMMLKTLDDMEERENILYDLREQILSNLSNASMPKKEVLQLLFDAVDTDKSGFIDRIEFKRFLQTLRLSYSDDRFNLLYRAVDVNCDYFISFDEIETLIFPPNMTQEEATIQEELSQVIRRQSVDVKRPSILDMAAMQKAAAERKILIKALEQQEVERRASQVIEEDDNDSDDDDDDDYEGDNDAGSGGGGAFNGVEEKLGNSGSKQKRDPRGAIQSQDLPNNKSSSIGSSNSPKSTQNHESSTSTNKPFSTDGKTCTTSTVTNTTSNTLNDVSDEET